MFDKPQKPWPPLAREAFREMAERCRQKAIADMTDERLSPDERAEGLEALNQLAIEFERKTQG
jgi:hypothetical protein